MATQQGKKRAANTIMVIAGVVLVVAGIAFALNLKTGSAASTVNSLVTATDKYGNVNIERSGLGYYLEGDTALEDNDIVETLSDAQLTLNVDNQGQIRMSEITEVVAQKVSKSEEATNEPVRLGLKKGELFITGNTETSESVQISTSLSTFTVKDAVCAIQACSGSVTVQVLSGEVNSDTADISIKAGQSFSVINSNDANSVQSETGELTASDLSDFALAQAQKISDKRTLCFDTQTLKGTASQRVDEKAQAQSSTASDSAIATTGNGTSSSSGESASGGSTGTESSSSTLHSCTIQIRCDTILNNMDSLTSGKEACVPANGTILATSTVQFNEGDTAFDVLKAACNATGIQLEYSYTPGYDSYYVQGINNLYEFDCGSESGWMYKVNGWFPNYGASAYTLKDGDAVVWCYTCSGLGADVGGAVG